MRSVSLAGVVATIAGGGSQGFADGAGTDAVFNSPYGVRLVAPGSLVVADAGNNCLRKVDAATRAVTAFAGLCDSTQSGFADGAGTWARFNYPMGLAAAASGELFVADLQSGAVRAVSPVGVVTTIAGNGNPAGDYWGAPFPDGAGTSAQFWWPKDVAVSPSDGALLVADYYAVRMIAPGGSVTTFAGSPPWMSSSTPADGIGTNAVFGNVVSVAFDPAGTLFVSDMYAQTIRSVTSSAVVATIAGSIARGGSITDGVGTNAGFYEPTGIAADAAGNLVVIQAGAIRALVDCMPALGYYGPPGAVVPPCKTACPAGSFCPTSAAGPTQCGAGTWCAALAGAPTPCAAGNWSATLGATTACTNVCPAGFFCAAGATAPVPCGNGTYSAAGSAACTPAAAGYFSGIATGQVPCPAGSFCPAGAAAPTQCAAGSYSGYPAAEACLQAPAGSFCAAGALQTTPCPEGSFCAAGSGAPQMCEAGSYALARSAACTQAPAGTFCGANASRTVPCPAGAFCPAGAGAPQLCPPGTFSAAQGQADASTCSPCYVRPGFACFEGATSEAGTRCLSGYICPGEDSPPVPCPCPGACNSTGLKAFDSTCSATATVSPSATPPATPSRTWSAGASQSATAPQTPSQTPSFTISPTATPSHTTSRTPTPSLTSSPTPSVAPYINFPFSESYLSSTGGGSSYGGSSYSDDPTAVGIAPVCDF